METLDLVGGKTHTMDGPPEDREGSEADRGGRRALKN